MRSPTSGILAQLVAQGSQPGYLVEIITNTQTLNLTSLDEPFYFNATNWTAADITFNNLNWTTRPNTRVNMTLGDPLLAFWSLAGNYILQDSLVNIWGCYAAAQGEAEPMYQGRVGAIKKGNMILECELVADNTLRGSPRRRIQTIVPAKFLLPPGKEIMIGTQKWILSRG
jgi:hypothetical protein